MEKRYRLWFGAALITMVATPLWFDAAFAPERAVAQRVESLMLPTAAAAVIVPAATRIAPPASPEQFEAARLMMVGTMLFGLAAVVRKAI
jgi:hypothetical protein